jgi:ubiquinone/menaquinone biosynthesis C-methylase UbiE
VLTEDKMLNDNQYSNPAKFNARIYLNSKFKTNPKSWFTWIFEHFPKNENLKVLELGCGTGLFWLSNRNEIPDTWTITLSDYSEGMLETTRQNLSKLKRDFQYNVVNAENITYPDESFDIIIANNMLYHVEDRSKSISHIRRTLKSNGVFFASTMGNKDMLELNNCFCEFLQKQNKPFKFREKSFSLENGLEQLKPYFPKVTIDRYEDVLKIDEVEPIIDYYLSLNEMYNNRVVLSDYDIDPFRKYLEGILDSKKNIPVTTDRGLFICSK